MKTKEDKEVENITLGDIAKVLSFVVGIGGSIAYLKEHLQNQLTKHCNLLTKRLTIWN